MSIGTRGSLLEVGYLVPQTVIAKVIAVVAEEYYYRVVGQAVFVESLDKLAYLGVDIRDAGIVGVQQAALCGLVEMSGVDIAFERRYVGITFEFERVVVGIFDRV